MTKEQLKQRILILQERALTYDDASSDALKEAGELLVEYSNRVGMRETGHLIQELELETAFLRDLAEEL